MLKQLKHNKLGDINYWCAGDKFLNDPIYLSEINGKQSVPNYFYDISSKYFSISNYIESGNLDRYTFLKDLSVKYMKRMLSKLTVVSVVLRGDKITKDMFMDTLDKSLMMYIDIQIKELKKLIDNKQPCVLCHHYNVDYNGGFACTKTNDSEFCKYFEIIESYKDIRSDWEKSLKIFYKFKKKYQDKLFNLVHIDENGAPWFYLDVIDKVSNKPEYSFLVD